MTLIACVSIPNLPIMVARQAGEGSPDAPLVLYTNTRQRALVYAASPDAGVATGMPLQQARVRCPHAIYQCAVPERDGEVVATLTALLRTFSPRVALVDPLPDVAITLDLGRLTRAQTLAQIARIGHGIRATVGLRPAIGVASNQLVARHAAQRAGPDVALAVPTGQEAAFLAPQPITSLPLDAALLHRLERLGVRTIGALAQLPLDALQAAFGASGQQLYQLAHGVDTGTIALTRNAPSLSRTRRFAGPLLERGLLERTIIDLAERLTAQLIAEGWAAGRVVLTLPVDDGVPVLVEQVLAEPTSDRGRLAHLMLALSRRAVLESGVTAVTVTASDLTPVIVAQMELFAPAGGQAHQLGAVLDRLRGGFAGSLLRATLAEPAAQLPERRVRLEPR
jgi:DNA polymerase-4